MTDLDQWAARHGVSQAAMLELQHLFNSNVTPGEAGPSEGAAQALIRLEAPKHGAMLWRNNSGALMDDDGRMVRFGLGNDSAKVNKGWKSSDLIGITPVHWQGYTFGVFTAVEVKRPGWKKPQNARDRAQLAFMTTVKAYGGRACFATSAEDYREGILK